MWGVGCGVWGVGLGFGEFVSSDSLRERVLASGYGLVSRVGFRLASFQGRSVAVFQVCRSVAGLQGRVMYIGFRV